MILGIKESEGRYERKFSLSDISKQEVEFAIKMNQGMFSEIFHQRAVNNIYFDSVDMNSYQDNLSGVSQRMKVRIRWYGKMEGYISKPVLEIKIKESDVGTKLSFPLKAFTLDNKFSIKLLERKVFSKSDLPTWLVEHLKSIRFALLNRYERKYFQSADKKYRITLDFDLEFYRINNMKNTFIEKISHPEKVILELKYSKTHDNQANKITNEFDFRLTKSSKYVFGIEVFND